jgi:hypothetical protein
MVPRPPCPSCGGKGIAFQIGVAEEIDTAESLTVGLAPADQSRGWERRWVDAQAHLERLVAAHPGEFSGAAIHAAGNDLLNFFVQAYHLKDALIAETELGRRTIEDAITADPVLALLADLANLNKHFELTKPPRSGEAPTIGQVQGTSAGHGNDGWHLELSIHHCGRIRDGLAFAKETLEAWERLLISWGLI